MSTNETTRRLRGALRNGVVWGIGWFLLGLLVTTVMVATGAAPEGISWLDGVGMSIKVGVVGGICGAAFALAIALVYRGRRLRDISWWRFALGGGVATGLFIPLFLQTMNLVGGGPMVPFRLLVDDLITGLVFGAVLAGGSLFLAQRAERAGGLDAGDRLDALGEGDRFGRTIDPARAREAVDASE